MPFKKALYLSVLCPVINDRLLFMLRLEKNLITKWLWIIRRRQDAHKQLEANISIEIGKLYSMKNL